MDLGTLITQLVTAWNGHAYALVVALLVGAIVALAKQGYFSAWLAGHLPSKALPFISIILGVLGTTAAQIVAGIPWIQALINGVLAGAAAVAGHQTVIESMRSGKEIIPATAKVSAQAPPQSPPPPPITQRDIPVHVKYKSDSPPPVAKRETLWFPKAVVVAACLSLVTVTTGCTAAQWQAVEATTKDLIAYVNMFLPAIEAIWTMILPTLGAQAADANAAFNKAVVDVSNAASALLDALHVADALQQPTPDLTALEQAVKDAVARLTTIVDQYRTAAPPALGERFDALHAHARAISAWR